MTIHGEISQSVGTTYFDVSVPENEKLETKTVEKAFSHYWGAHIEYPTYKKDGRQHYKIAAYKD